MMRTINDTIHFLEERIAKADSLWQSAYALKEDLPINLMAFKDIELQNKLEAQMGVYTVVKAELMSVLDYIKYVKQDDK